MTSMREKIARAIDPSAFRFWQQSYDYEMLQSGDDKEAQGFANWAHSTKSAFERADAVLDALMDPTDGMALASVNYAEDVSKRLTEENEALKCSHDELLKLAADLGEPDDPFAAWEALVALNARIKALEEALRAVSDTSHRTTDRMHYCFPLAVMQKVDAALKENAL